MPPPSLNPPYTGSARHVFYHPLGSELPFKLPKSNGRQPSLVDNLRIILSLEGIGGLEEGDIPSHATPH